MLLFPNKTLAEKPVVEEKPKEHLVLSFPRPGHRRRGKGIPGVQPRRRRRTMAE
jgi:hypothetical protein